MARAEINITAADLPEVRAAIAILKETVDGLAYGLRDRADFTLCDPEDAPDRWIDYDAEIGWMAVRPARHGSIAVPIADGWPEAAALLEGDQ